MGYTNHIYPKESSTAALFDEVISMASLFRL